VHNRQSLLWVESVEPLIRFGGGLGFRVYWVRLPPVRPNLPPSLRDFVPGVRRGGPVRRRWRSAVAAGSIAAR